MLYVVVVRVVGESGHGSENVDPREPSAPPRAEAAREARDLGEAASRVVLEGGARSANFGANSKYSPLSTN